MPLIGLQLYSLRDACQTDFLATIRAVAGLGYDGVEFAGFYDRAAPEVRQTVTAAGLTIMGAHVGIDLLLPDNFNATVEYHQALGNHCLVIPGLPEAYRQTAADCRRTAALLTEICEKLRPLAIKTGYHSHASDVTPLADGAAATTIYDLIISNTPADFIMQIDVGNTVEAGVNPLPYFGRYPRRASQIHLKEARPGKANLPFGTGAVAWEEVLRAAATFGGTKEYLVEVERSWDEPADCARQDRDFLHRLGL
jgi:sugar phosphate isomerase/epimerase